MFQASKRILQKCFLLVDKKKKKNTKRTLGQLRMCKFMNSFLSTLLLSTLIAVKKAIAKKKEKKK